MSKSTASASRIKPGRWMGVEFTADQVKARKIWKAKEKRRTEITDTLHSVSYLDRDEAHKRLDRVFDTIERQTERAVKLFPEVGESFTVASFTISL